MIPRNVKEKKINMFYLLGYVSSNAFIVVG